MRRDRVSVFRPRLMAGGLLLAGALLASPAVAQPPDITNWTGPVATPGQVFAQGRALTLTWGFMNDGTGINDAATNGITGDSNGPSNLKGFLNGIFTNQATWQPLFQSVFDRWSSISGLTYVFEANDDSSAIGNNGASLAGSLGVRADLRIGGRALDGNSGVLAYNYFPNVGDMVIDTSDNFFSTGGNFAANSLRLRNVVSHEHGHGQGHSHVLSNNGVFLMEPFIDLSFDGPQLHDILMAHRGYGDFNEKSNAQLGNDIAANATSLGAIASGNQVQRGTSVGNTLVEVNPGDADFISIDDQGDIDFFSFSVAAPGTINILLEARGFTYNTTAQFDGLGNPLNGDVPFDILRRQNLALALFDTDGATILQSVNATGLGGNESINFFLGAAGTYFIRVTGTDNPDALAVDTQFYRLTAGFTIAAVPEPGTMALMGMAGLGGLGYWRRRRQDALLGKRNAVVER